MTRFEHDKFGNLASAQYQDNTWDYKLPDEIGNLFKTKDKTDRIYGKAGQLLKDENYTYTYDEVGNLIQKTSPSKIWSYEWSQNGMLQTVIRPDKNKVSFTYDALGRRLTKTYLDQTIHFVWDGNIPLHQWTAPINQTITSINNKGKLELNIPKNLTTWIFEEGTFVPQAKLINGKSYSIITDHLGTPFEAYSENGEKVWSCNLDIYGKTRKFTGERSFIPFLFQGQYYDEETELAYNRFRYYNPDTGGYISKDPISIAGGLNLYAYVSDSNSQLDVFGLMPFTPKPITDGSVFRGVTSGQPPFSPSPSDLANASTHPGISSKPKLNSQANKFFDKIGAEVREVEVSKLKNLSVIQDGKAHASIMPSDDYLKKNNMSMTEALEDWAKGGDNHKLSKELKGASKCL